MAFLRSREAFRSANVTSTRSMGVPPNKAVGADAEHEPACERDGSGGPPQLNGRALDRIAITAYCRN